MNNRHHSQADRRRWYRRAYREGVLQMLTIVALLAALNDIRWLFATPVAIFLGLGIGWLVRDHQERAWLRRVW